MSRPTSNLRLFVAAYPPREVVQAVLERLKRLAMPARARILPEEQVHLTLQFIGDTPASEMDATIESVRRAASGLRRFALNLQALIRLPERGPARLIAAETDAPGTLIELHKRLVQRLARHPRERASDRFRPHMTLVRFATPEKRYSLDADSATLDGSFMVDRILLMRSTLSHQGAVHHPVEAVEFGV